MLGKDHLTTSVVRPGRLAELARLAVVSSLTLLVAFAFWLSPLALHSFSSIDLSSFQTPTTASATSSRKPLWSVLCDLARAPPSSSVVRGLIQLFVG